MSQIERGELGDDVELASDARKIMRTVAYQLKSLSQEGMTHAVISGHQDSRLPNNGMIRCESKDDWLILHNAIAHWALDENPCSI